MISKPYDIVLCVIASKFKDIVQIYICALCQTPLALLISLGMLLEHERLNSF